MMEDTFDVDKFRTAYESNTEWRERKKFIQAHHDKFDEPRLVCLSQCYLNVKQTGCKYPMEVMRQLHELAKEMDEELMNTDN